MTNEPELTPAERAALAARGWYDRVFQRGEPLRDQATKLLYVQLGQIYAAGPERCPTCDAGGHTCPGCGHPTPHGDGPVDYSDHGPGCPGFEAWHLERSLEDYALGVVTEWMRIIELERLPGQPRVTWQDAAGTFILGEHPHGDEYGRFRLKVTVETLPPLPPIGPENDPAQIEEAAEYDERPMHWGDDDHTACGKFSGMVYQYTGDSRKVTCAECLERGNNQPEWVLRTMVDVRDGDTIRMPGRPGTERAVWTTSPVLQHHIHPAGQRWDPKPADWAEIKVRFVAAADALSFDPALPVEIYTTTSELAAIEALGGWANRVRVTPSVPNPAAPERDGMSDLYDCCSAAPTQPHTDDCQLSAVDRG